MESGNPSNGSTLPETGTDKAPIEKDTKMRIIQASKSLWSDRRGVTAVEYGLIASLIAGALVLTLGTFTTALKGVFTTISGSL